MKIIKSTLCFIVVMAIAGCSEDYPLKEEQYQKFVYLSRAVDNELKTEYVNYIYEQDTMYVSVSVSGSVTSSKDIKVTLQEENGAISNFNKLNLSPSDIQYRHLPEGAYTYPFSDVTVKAGETMAMFPIYVYPELLHCDSLYLLPFSIESVSLYEKKIKKDTVLLAQISVENKYSGTYYMHGIKTEVETGSSSNYQLYRTAVATNKSTIRIFQEVNETKNYLQSHTLTLSLNEDNTVTFGTWNKFDLISGSGTYLPEMKLFDIKYEFMENGKKYRVEGYFYKRPKTELEQEDIDDWIRKEEERKREEE